MAKAAERDPLKHLFVVCTALLAVMLNVILLVCGGGLLVLIAGSLMPMPQTGTVLGVIVPVTLMAAGLINLVCMGHVFGYMDLAKPRMFTIVNVVNGVLIALSAVFAFVGAGPIELGLVFLTPVTTLIAVHVGKTKPIPAGHCQTCGYDLAGLELGVCPECGAAR